MAEEDSKEVEEVKQPSMIKKLLVPLVLSLVLTGGALGALNFLGVISFVSKDAALAEGMEGEEGEEITEGEGGEQMVDGPDAGTPAFFFTFYPDFLVNFNSNGKAHYLKLSIDVMSRDESVVAGMDQFQPILRSNLLKKFKELDFESLKTTDGVESMQTVAFDEIQRLLKKYHGNNSIEGVYFSTFVIQ